MLFLLRLQRACTGEDFHPHSLSFPSWDIARVTTRPCHLSCPSVTLPNLPKKPAAFTYMHQRSLWLCIYEEGRGKPVDLASLCCHYSSHEAITKHPSHSPRDTICLLLLCCSLSGDRSGMSVLTSEPATSVWLTKHQLAAADVL